MGFSHRTPRGSVEITIEDCLSNMLRSNGFTSCQVGNRTRHLKNTIIGTCRETKTLHCLFEKLHSLLVGASKTLRQGGGHLSIAVHVGEVGKASRLSRTSGYYPRTDKRRGLCRGGFGNFIKRNGGNFYLNVNTIHQGTRYLRQVFLHRTRGTNTLSCGMIIIATRAGIHCCNQHKRGGIIHRGLSSGDRDSSLLHGLPHELQNTPIKLRQLI